MTPESVKAYEQIGDAIHRDASEILARLIRLRDKYSISLRGLYNYHFERVIANAIVYSGGSDYCDFYIPIEALYNPDAYFEKEELKMIHDAEMDRKREAFMMTPEKKKQAALAKLTAEEKQLLGLL